MFLRLWLQEAKERVILISQNNIIFVRYQLHWKIFYDEKTDKFISQPHFYYNLKVIWTYCQPMKGGERGGHTGLWCDTSPRKGLCHCLMPDYTRRCRTSPLIMVPINFWRNSDPFKKKNIFLAQKLTKLEHFL